MPALQSPVPEIPVREIEVAGVTTAFRTLGDPQNEPLLLLHGMSNSGDTYRELMPHLAESRWVIAPDLPGHGRSGMLQLYTLTNLAAWLDDLIAALGITHTAILGHSFGGALAVAYADRFPKKVSRLILVAPAVLAGSMLPDFVKRAGIRSGLVDLSATLSQSGIFSEQQVAHPFYDTQRIPEVVRKRQMRAYQQARASADVLKALAFVDMQPMLARLQVPVLVVWGENDPVLPVAHAAEIERLLSNGRIVTWEACGHLPFLERPTQFLDVAGRFLDEGLRQRSPAAGDLPNPVISVFGSSAPLPGSPPYETALEVGALLARAGFAVATGGYGGTMAAVSQGAAEAGGDVIGVTSDQIEQFRPLGPNQWVGYEVRYPTLRERLQHLVTDNQGMIVLPGGIGTLSEMALAWSFLQVGEMPPRPLALLGDQWQRTVAAFVDPQYVRPEHQALLLVATDPAEAVSHVTTFSQRAGLAKRG